LFTMRAMSFMIDTGASITITNSSSDFTGPVKPIKPQQLQGIASGLTVKRIESTTYIFCSDIGSYTSLTLHNVLFSRTAQSDYYVPDISQKTQGTLQMVSIPNESSVS
jgi:hypothetical protein